MNERTAWLAERRCGIGASDSYIICGFAPPSWGKSWYQLYHDKIGNLPLDEMLTAAQRWGHRLEPLIAEEYALQTGHTVVTPSKKIVWSSTYDFLFASPDRFVETDSERFLLELKATNRYPSPDGSSLEVWGEPLSDQIPAMYMCQTQHQMLVTGMNRCDVAVFFGVGDVKIYRVFASRPLQEAILNLEKQFWGHVLNRQEPEPDWTHPETTRLWDLIQKPIAGSEIVLSTDYLSLCEQYKMWQQVESQAAKNKKECRTQLLPLLGQAAKAHCGDYRIERKVIQKPGYWVEAREEVRLTISYEGEPIPLSMDESLANPSMLLSVI